MIKIVFALRRKPGMSKAEFDGYWKHEHGPRVKARIPKFDGVRYVQVRTIEGPATEMLRRSRGSSEAYDGVAEIYWASRESFDQSFDTAEARQAGLELLEDEKNFIDLARSALWIAEDDEIYPGSGNAARD